MVVRRWPTTEGERPTTLFFYFFGCTGVVAGAAGCDLVCDELNPCNTDDPVPPRRWARIESEIEVTIKMIADQVVARDRAEAAPRGPKAV